MSKADEMFEELGYKKAFSSSNEIIEYCKENLYIIRFYISSKRVWTNLLISIQELQAINKKVKELGWLDE